MLNKITRLVFLVSSEPDECIQGLYKLLSQDVNSEKKCHVVKPLSSPIPQALYSPLILIVKLLNISYGFWGFFEWYAADLRCGKVLSQALFKEIQNNLEL